MKFRIVKDGKRGKYRVERKAWFGWTAAIVYADVWAEVPVYYDTVEEARADMVQRFQTPDEVVWESPNASTD
jgi:hypothetical protein